MSQQDSNSGSSAKPPESMPMSAATSKRPSLKELAARASQAGASRPSIPGSIPPASISKPPSEAPPPPVSRTPLPSAPPPRLSETGKGKEDSGVVDLNVINKTATAEQEAPILPTFVFVPADRLPDLARIIAGPHGHPAFSIFRYAGRVPLIADAQMAMLRAEEAREAELLRLRTEEKTREAARLERIALLRTEQARRKALRSQRRVMEAGTRVAVAQAPSLAGMTGVVEAGDGKSYFVVFGGMLKMKIEAWQLTPVAVHDVNTAA